MLALLCLFLAQVSLWRVVTAEGTGERLVWHNITDAVDRGALCNDFSTAGYFLRMVPSSRHWVVFLEGGGGCASLEDCTVRYIDQEIRERYQHQDSASLSVVTDVEAAYRDHGTDQHVFTSKLMTSLWTFRDSPQHTEVLEDQFSVEGTDLLSTDPTENPFFHNYSHVVIPYCSSDLWLGASDNHVLAQQASFQFRYHPNASLNEFTFRGEAIFKSVFSDLWRFHGLEGAADLVLAGSSAGGIGVLNHAKWVEEQVTPNGTHLSVIMDSAWFINFHGNMERRFSPTTLEYLGIPLNHSCNDLSDGAPCCLTASCMLGKAHYYPEGMPTLVVFSLYDLYFLLDSVTAATEEGKILDVLRITAEYAGEMNASLLRVELAHPGLSYFMPSCFQHVYLASTSLWGGLLGDADLGQQYEDKSFSHTIQSGLWRSFPLTVPPGETAAEAPTLRNAMGAWLQSQGDGPVVRRRDYCKGPHCNNLCPETIVLSYQVPYLHPVYQWTVCGVVVGFSLLCILLKVMHALWMKRLKNIQDGVLEWLDSGPNRAEKLARSSSARAITLACLRLKYWVRMSQQDLKKAKQCATPARGRLLSIAAAYDSNPAPSPSPKADESAAVELGQSGCLSEGQSGEGDLEDLESGSSNGQDLAASIREFNAMRHANMRSGRKLNNLVLRSKEKSQSKPIIQGITTFFQPGELVGIMGPSGSGKTTFLDLLTGRRRTGKQEGKIYVNNLPVDGVRDWYMANTGYVLQLASPFYEELTVRENLTLAAQMRLPQSFKASDRFMRIEQVMNETGLTELANTVVGGCTGAGLSGGQKRRLCVAIQLLSMPSLIFLDEPTSGLDAASSYELLCYLEKLARSNRSVILTIHQPRQEIFNMFHKVILLCQGKIVYHGVPEEVSETFTKAHQEMHVRLPQLESKNPADVMIDMLGSQSSRNAILNYYNRFLEPSEVQHVLTKCGGTECENARRRIRRKPPKDAGFWNQYCALEARGMQRAKLGTQLYLPVIFIGYAILLGTVYLQSESGTQIISGFGVFSCASGLFMFPLVYGYLYRALELFSLEYADGIGKPSELILQTFVRFISLSFAPLVLCAVFLYLLAVPAREYDLVTLIQVAVFNVAMNQTWISMLIFIICLTPMYCHRISPIVSAVAGFAGGFFVPPSLMPPWYSWLFYVNPNYFGFAAMARLLLNDIEFACVYESELECYAFSATYILEYFDLNTTRPFVYLLILLGMTVGYLILAWLTVWLKHAHVKQWLQRLKKMVTRRKLSQDRPDTTLAREPCGTPVTNGKQKWSPPPKDNTLRTTTSPPQQEQHHAGSTEQHHAGSTEQHHYCMDTLQQLMKKRNQQWAEIEADALQMQRRQQLDRAGLLSGHSALEEETKGSMDLVISGSAVTAPSDDDDDNSVFFEDQEYSATDAGWSSADGTVRNPVEPVNKQNNHCSRPCKPSRQHLLSSHTSWLSDSCDSDQPLQGDAPCLVYPVVPRYRLRTISGELKMDTTEV